MNKINFDKVTHPPLAMVTGTSKLIAYSQKITPQKRAKLEETKLSKAQRNIDNRIKTNVLDAVYLRRVLLRLEENDQQIMRLWLSNYLSFPNVALLLQQWEDIIADKVRYHILKEQVLTVLSDKVWYIRILYRPDNRTNYLDVRQWEQVNGVSYPTMNGLQVSLPNWFKLFEIIGKLLIKHTK